MTMAMDTATIRELARLIAEERGLDPDAFERYVVAQIIPLGSVDYDRLKKAAVDFAQQGGEGVPVAPVASPSPVPSSGMPRRLPGSDFAPGMADTPPDTGAPPFPGATEPDSTVTTPTATMPPVAVTPVAPPAAPGPTAGKQFSAYDDIIRKYAGDLAGDPQFIAVVAAGMQAESGQNPQSFGDNGQSTGLFHMHAGGAGAGWSVADRQDPDKAASKMVPIWAAAYKQGLARSLTGRDLAAFTGVTANRPDDRKGEASATYRSAYDVVTGRGGPDPSTGAPGAQLTRDANGNLTTIRPRANVSLNSMNTAEAERYYPFGGNPAQGMSATEGNSIAGRNVLRDQGYGVDSGHPFMRLLEHASANMGQMANWAQRATDKAYDPAAIAQDVGAKLSGGRTSYFSLPEGQAFLQQVVDLTRKAMSGETIGSNQAELADKLKSPSAVADAVFGAQAAGLAPSLRYSQGAQDAIQKRMYEQYVNSGDTGKPFMQYWVEHTSPIQPATPPVAGAA